MDKGYILLSRSILDSDVFASQKLLKIWMWCLCKANFKDRAVVHLRGNGEQIIKCKRGQFIFGRYKAEEELMIDGSTIYKSIKKLEKMNMIKIDSNKSFSVITICKYDSYQDNSNYKVTRGKQDDTHTIPTEYPQSNTTNTLPNVNNDKKDKFSEWLNYRIEIKKPIKSKSTLTTLINRFNEEPLNIVIEVVNNSIENGYQGLFWDKVKKDIKPKPSYKI